MLASSSSLLLLYHCRFSDSWASSLTTPPSYYNSTIQYVEEEGIRMRRERKYLSFLISSPYTGTIRYILNK
jgi:hypothetical protein